MPFTGELFSLSEIKEHALTLTQELKQLSVQDISGQFIALPKLEKALTQFFESSEKIETQPELFKTDINAFGNISELGDYGLQLLAGLEQWQEIAKPENKIDVQIMVLSLAIWIHDNQGTLENIENIVNALSTLANQISEPSILIKLHKCAEKITNATNEAIKADIDKTEPGRPWRILNLNHGIIATRTHNIDIMNAVFEQLLTRLPEDAANFFADGMKQMDIIGYPEHVRHVMEQFFKLTNQPTLH